MESDGEEATVLEARKYLREKLFSINHDQEGGLLSNESTPQSRKDAYIEIREQLKYTILQGLGSSILLLGPPGSGKTWLVNEVLRDLNSDPKCGGNFLLVRLHGQVHVDDYQALLSVAAQLDLNEELGESIHMPFTAALNYLLDTLWKGSRSKKSLVCILEHFDLFARHKNQTLLYNLLDIAQGNCNPLAVVGITQSLGAIEMLEKRVKSRFLHRKVYLFFDYDLEAYTRIFRDLLSLPRNFKNKTFLRRWKQRIEELCHKPAVQDSLRKLFHNCPSIQTLKLFLALPVSSLRVGHPLLDAGDLSLASNPVTMLQHSREAVLRSLSVLELTLMVSIHHVSQLSEQEPFNFEMVYDEYKKFAQRSQSVKFFSKPVAMKAFEHLLDLELVHPANSRGASSAHQPTSKATTMKEYRLMTLRVHSEQIKEAVKSYPNCPTELHRWGLSRTMRT